MALPARLLAPFALDLRSLAVLRVLLGLLVLHDVQVRALDLTAFYTDAGVLPRADVPEDSRWASVHFLGGSVGFQAVLFAVHAALAVALTLGYRTSLAAAGCWFLVVSVQARNNAVGHGGDVLMRLLLFWGFFLPLGARWSLDARRAGSKAAAGPQAVVSAATAALVLQAAFVYVFSALMKTGDPWRTTFTATQVALNIDQFATSVGKVVREYPALLKGVTVATLVLEAFGPLLLFVPWAVGPVRTAVVLAFVGFHAGLAVCMHIGNFPFVCMTMWVGLLPTWAWERVGAATVPGFAAAGRMTLLERILVPLLVGYAFLWQLRELNPDRFGVLLPADLNWVGGTFRVDQRWDMFAPNPSDWDGWYVVEGHLADGRTVDLATGGPVTFDKPADVAATFDGERWRKYLINLTVAGNEGHRPGYARWRWRRWEAEHPWDGLTRVTVWFVLEHTRADGTPAPPEKLSQVTVTGP